MNKKNLKLSKLSADSRAIIRYADLWARPGFLIRRLHQIHVGLFAEECREFDMTPIQFGVLTVLYTEDALDQNTVSAAIGIDRTTGAGVIKRLQRRQLLTRIRSDQDARARLVRITDQGRALVRAMQPAMIKAQERLVAPLSAAEHAQLDKLMQKLILANDSASRAPIQREFRTAMKQQPLPTGNKEIDP